MPSTILIALAAAAALQTGPAAYDGDWDGGIIVPAGLTIPLRLHLKGPQGTLDSPDQNAFGAPVLVIPTDGGLSLDLPAAHAGFKGRLMADGALEGTWTQGASSLPARFVRRAAGAPPPGPRRPQTPLPPFPYTAEDVRLPGGAAGVTLAGTLTRPPGARPAPAVLLIAGSGPQSRDEVVMGHRIFLLLADRLTRAGFAVLRYDKRGVGGSTGDARRVTGPDYVDDARAAYDWLRGQPGIDPVRVGLLGHSEGAEVAPSLAAAATAAPPAFLVLLGAPGVRGDEALPAQIAALETAAGVPPAKVAADVALERKVLAEVVCGGSDAEIEARVIAVMREGGLGDARAAPAAKEAASPWLRAFLAHDPIPELRRLRQPVLAVYGGKDLQVPPAVNAQPLRAALAANRRAEVVELPGLNHLLQPATTGLPQEYGAIETTVDPKALDLIVGWATKAAGLPPPR